MQKHRNSIKIWFALTCYEVQTWKLKAFNEINDLLYLNICYHFKPEDIQPNQWPTIFKYLCHFIYGVYKVSLFRYLYSMKNLK